MAGVKLTQLSKQYQVAGQALEAVDNVTTTIEPGSFTVIVGRSGCGKTTLLRLLSGLEQKSSGSIEWLGAAEGGAAAKVGIVFQEPRLMPWLTVYENMAFALAGQPDRTQVDRQVNGTLEQLGLTGFRDAYPSQLSGGMAQRVSLGRTLCYDPDLILMDEPFGALDYFTRKKLQRELVELFLRQHKTIVFVTHDVTEAVYLGQKVLVMEAGQIVREVPIDTPYPRQVNDPTLIERQQEILAALEN
jgi:sulfonate transport system ATP-binding protein